jgi:hypothetical protein
MAIRDTEIYDIRQRDQDKNRGNGGATGTQNFPKNLGFRITEGLLFDNGINCNEI